MGPEVVNKNKNCVFNGPYAGRDLYITMLEDTERKFVVTHKVNIKPTFYFTGRETELLELSQRIEDGRKSVLVSGMGGIGKTQICRKLFDEYNTRNGKGENVPFQHMGFIEYDGDMDSSLQNCLQYKKQDNPDQNKEAAWRELEYLAADGKLLLFVDNVDKSINSDQGLQRLKSIQGAIVLTSRQASFGDEFEPFPIGFLGRERCIEIYEKIRFRGSGRKVSSEEVPDLKYVIESLAGRHTITVEFLAHLAHTKLWTVKRLREELEQKGFRLEFHKEGELINIQESYEKLYDLSELSKAEQNILEAFSVFPYIPLEVGICNQWLLSDAGVDEDDDTLTGLYQKGWLQFDLEQEGYSLHPVFAQFIYEKCRPKLERHLGLVKSCEESIFQPFRSTFECWPFIPFAVNIFEKVDFRQRIEYNRFTDQLASWFTKVGEYEEAEKWYRRSYDIFKEIKGEYHPITLEAYSNLAFSHENLGNYESAEKEYKESLKGWEYVPVEEKDFLAIISTYECLENLYINEGEYEKAEALYEKMLSIEEKRLRENPWTLAITYYNYANRYVRRGKYGRAEKLYEKNLMIQKNMLEENDLNIMSCYYELGKVYMMDGKYQDALTCFLEMHKIGTDTYKASFSDIYEIMKDIYVKKRLKGNFEQWLEEKMKECDDTYQN